MDCVVVSLLWTVVCAANLVYSKQVPIQYTDAASRYSIQVQIQYTGTDTVYRCSMQIQYTGTDIQSRAVITQAVPVQSSALAVHGNQHFTSAAQCSAVQCSAVPCTTHCTISTISTVQSSAAQCSAVQAWTVIPRAAHRHSHGRPPPSQMAIYSGHTGLVSVLV